MKIEREFTVGIQNIGIHNKITNYAYLGFLEEIGCNHSDIAQMGINNIPKTRKAWLLMDWKLNVLERPKYGDKITVRTWGRPIEKHLFYTYRDFEVYFENRLIAKATSKWVLYDIDLKKIVKITEDIYSKYEPEDKNVFEEKEISKIIEPEKKDYVKQYIVERADIDINKHMHNLNYLKVAYEILPEEAFLEEEKQNVKIMYKHQILLGETINAYYTKENEKHIITLKSNDDKVLHAIIELF